MYLNLITRSLYTHKYDHGTLVPQIQEAYHTKSIHFLYQCHEKKNFNHLHSTIWCWSVLFACLLLSGVLCLLIL